MRKPQDVRRIVQELSPGDEIVGAFVAVFGPRPGMEAFGLFAALPVLFMTSNTPAYFVVTIGACAAIQLSRHFCTVAVTPTDLILIETGKWHTPRADSPRRRERREQLVLEDTDEGTAAKLRGERAWFYGEHQDEARRLIRLIS